MTSHDERTAQLRRIRDAEKRSPEDNAFYAILALTKLQLLSVVQRYRDHIATRTYNDHVVLNAEFVKAGAPTVAAEMLRLEAVAELVEAATTFRRMPKSNDARIAIDAALARFRVQP